LLKRIDIIMVLKNVLKYGCIIAFLLHTLLIFSQEAKLLYHTKEKKIKSFRNLKFNSSNNFKGYYSDEINLLSRKYNYKKKYEKTPYITEISLITMNTSNIEAEFFVYISKVDTNGGPSITYLKDKFILKAQPGLKETKLILDEPILIPKKGFFVVIERPEENAVLGISPFKFEKGFGYKQPTFGFVSGIGEREETWKYILDQWKNPKDVISFGPINNLAVNITLNN